MTATLVIGVGGTGAHVVSLVHERLERDFGKNQSPKSIGLVALDARSAPELLPWPTPIPHTNTTPIDYPRAWSEFSNEIGPWWPSGISRGEPAITFTGGCGAVRGHGRFFAFYYAKQLEATIRHVLNKMKAASPYGALPEQDLQVFICGSLGNGTGGGLFLDIGAMVKEITGPMYTAVRVFAMSLSSSVTMKGCAGLLSVRVGANGMAALIEAQHEFNRQIPGADSGVGRPYEPYQFRAWNGTQMTSFFADASDARSKAIPPIDYMYLFEEYDKAGAHHDFRSLRQAMAEAITALSGNTDTGLKALDAMVLAAGKGRFGSLCAVRLVVPQTQLVRFAVPELALRAIDAAVSNDASLWGHVLEERLPNGEVLLQERDATVERSVEVFVERVLAIREVGSRNQKSTEINQVFDRFKDDELELDEKVNAAATALGGDGRSVEEIASGASVLISVVIEQLEQLRQDWSSLLVGAPDSVWQREPEDAQETGGAGVRWLINWRVRRFVDAGAFGLLSAWLNQLATYIEENRKSVEENELREFLATHNMKDRAEAEAALGGMAKGLVEGKDRIANVASGLLKRFKRAALKSAVQKLAAEAQDHLRLAKSFYKTREVLRFYAQVFDHVKSLAAAANEVTSRLASSANRAPLQDKSRLAANKLEKMLGSEDRLGEGKPTELALAGSDEMRLNLVQQLHADVATSPAATLLSLKAVNAAFMANCLATDRVAAGGFASAVSPVGFDAMNDFTVGYRKTLEETIERLAKPAFNSFCDVDRVLESEATSVVLQYEQAFVDNRGALNQNERAALTQEIETRFGANVMQHLVSLPWDDDRESARSNAVAALVAGQLYRYMSYTSPHWAVQLEAKKAAHIAPFVFFNYGKESDILARAVTMMQTLQLIPPGAGYMQVAANPALAGSRIDILAFEIGADLDSLGCVSDLREPYEKALKLNDFSPHLTKQYESVGRQWLQDRLPEPPAATLVFLAKHLGILVEESGGNFSLANELHARRTDDGAVQWAGHKKGYQLGRGIVAVSDRLDSEDKEGEQLKSALKHLCWEGLNQLAQTKQSWDAVADEVSSLANSLEERESQWGKQIKVVGTARSALEAMAYELRDSKGAVMPRVLR